MTAARDATPDGVPSRSVVLIVEDDRDVREAVREIIAYEGYSVAEAANGREALAYLATHARPDLVLLDLMMPVMNGLDFLDAVRRDPALVDLRVLLLSAQARGTLQAIVERTGAIGYLTKPVQLAPLLAAVHAHHVPGPPAVGLPEPLPPGAP